MLSYQHLYHAGNLADVHKHAALAFILNYLTKKDKPLSYIETHAGRGLYDLTAPEAARTGEAVAGIGRIADSIEPDHPYAARLAQTHARFGPSAYPGSPLIAALSLRPTDRIHLAELHPAEYQALKQTLGQYDIRIRQEDGLAMAQSLLPPTPRRGVLVIDPSWEVKTDYATLPRFIQATHRKWNVGMIVLWYPILRDARHIPMLEQLAAADLPGAFRHEVQFPPVHADHKMVGSGLFMVNAPWGIETAMAQIETWFQT